MKFFGRTFFEREVKSNPSGGALLVNNTLLYSPNKDPRKQFDEGFQKNVIVYRCIKNITTAISNLDFEFYRGETYIENHPVELLLKKPNPTESWDQFVSGLFTDYLATGEMFFSGVVVGGKLKEIWRQSPVYMQVKGGSSGLVDKYVLKNGGTEIVWPVDQITGRSEMFFMKMNNPLDYWRGQSPMQSAALAIDTHNNGLIWNSSLLANSGRPSGIVKFTGNPTAQTIDRLRELFKKKIQGSRNAGEIPMLVDGADWQATDNNPRDMDFINTLKETTKYIASAYGVPLPLVDNDAASYNNIEQAKELLYIDTVIPLFNSFLSHLNNWLAPFMNGAVIKLNMDDIPALERVRKLKFDTLVSGVINGVLTIDEARGALGYDPIGGVASSLLVPQGKIPLEMTGIDSQAQQDAILTDQNNTDLTGVGKVADTGLNGAQITALQSIVQSVADGMLPEATAIMLIMLAFPTIDKTEATSLVKPAVGFNEDRINAELQSTLKMIDEREMKHATCNHK